MRTRRRGRWRTVVFQSSAVLLLYTGQNRHSNRLESVRTATPMIESAGIDSTTRPMPYSLITFLFFCCALTATRASAQPLAVAAASDLQAALPAVAAQFEKETGHHATLTFGSSGNFFTQI